MLYSVRSSKDFQRGDGGSAGKDMASIKTFALALAVSSLGITACTSGQSEDDLMTAQIGVNAYLWRAALDTFDFMPLESADPRGGLIITDWYSSPEAPNERFKATVYILDTRLRADGINVSLFKQDNSTGVWTDAQIDPDTEIQLENAILTRARELKVGDFS